MNIKRNIFAVLATAVLLASCSQDEVMTDTGPDGLVPVTLSAAVGDGVQTRVIGDYDDEAEYYYVQVCRPDGTAYTDNDYATPTRLTDDNQDNIFTANIYLKASSSFGRTIRQPTSLPICTTWRTKKGASPLPTVWKRKSARLTRQSKPY